MNPSSLMRRTVLLVDDDPDMLDFLKTCVESWGYTAVAAPGAEAAITALATLKPDAVISDVDMPRMDGYQFCRHIRQSGTDDIPFIFCSAITDIPSQVKGLKLGADDYIAKPVEPELLEFKLRSLLDRSARLKRAFATPSAQSDGEIMRGTLGELRLADLLQLLDVRGLDAASIRLEGKDGKKGEIFTRHHRLLHVAMPPLSGRKALGRLLAWDLGSYRIDTAAYKGDPTIDAPITESLLRALTAIDEFRRLEASLADQGEVLSIQYSSDLAQCRFQEATLTVLGVASRHGHLGRILDESPLSDLETLRIVAELLQTRILAFEPSPDAIDSDFAE